jgi:hypothetical protein
LEEMLGINSGKLAYVLAAAEFGVLSPKQLTAALAHHDRDLLATCS